MTLVLLECPVVLVLPTQTMTRVDLKKLHVLACLIDLGGDDFERQGAMSHAVFKCHR